MKQKPKPPADLWAQLEQAVNKIQAFVPPKPPNAFTSAEFATKFNLTVDQARHRIKKLKIHGKIKRVGSSSNSGYYEFIG